MTNSAGNLPRRAELAPEQTWNLESIFANQEAWERAFDQVAAQLSEPELY